MEVKINANYKYSDRYQGESRLDLFNQHYISVRTQRFGNAKRFRMEVATLEPEGKKVNDIAWLWLIAALVSLAGCIFFIYTALSSPESLGITMTLSGSGILLLLAVAFAFLFRLNTSRKWVFVTRAARHPLVTIPFNNETRQQADEFAIKLTRAITNRVEKRGYSENDLFAGEMRMLRRLNETGIISNSTYDAAKKRMLDNNHSSHQTAVASPG